MRTDRRAAPLHALVDPLAVVAVFDVNCHHMIANRDMRHRRLVTKTLAQISGDYSHRACAWQQGENIGVVPETAVFHTYRRQKIAGFRLES